MPRSASSSAILRGTPLRRALSDVDRRGAGLDEGARRVAEVEWERLEGSPLSPLGLLDRALSSPWRSLALGGEALDDQIPALLRALSSS